MFYSGRLKTNNKQFDACLSGKPFKFKLGKGEVIKVSGLSMNLLILIVSSLVLRILIKYFNIPIQAQHQLAPVFRILIRI